MKPTRKAKRAEQRGFRKSLARAKKEDPDADAQHAKLMEIARELSEILTGQLGAFAAALVLRRAGHMCDPSAGRELGVSLGPPEGLQLPVAHSVSLEKPKKGPDGP